MLHLLPHLAFTLLCLCSHLARWCVLLFLLWGRRRSQATLFNHWGDVWISVVLHREETWLLHLNPSNKNHMFSSPTPTTLPPVSPQPTRNPSPPRTTPNCLSMRNRGSEIQKHMWLAIKMCTCTLPFTDCDPSTMYPYPRRTERGR